MKKMKNALKFRGILTIRDFKTKEILLVKENLITNVGLAIVTAQLGAGTTPLTTACVGEGTATAAYTDTALASQVDAQTPTVSYDQTTVDDDTVEFVSVHTAPAGGWDITEYGIKTTAGLLFNRVVFAAIPLAEDNQLEFTYRVIATRA